MVARAHAVTNADVARVFRDVADLLEVERANPFRIRAYRTAARTVEELPEPVASLVRGHRPLDELPGIGEDLASKIEEVVHTGSLGALRELTRAAPRGATELMRVPGIGPKRARLLCERLHVHSLAGLERAARAGRVRKVRGFGPTVERRILEELTTRTAEAQRLPRPRAAEHAEALAEHLRGVDGVDHVDIAGSYRRCRDTVGDVDILVACDRGAPVVDRFVTYPAVRRVLARGRTKASVRLDSGLQVDLRVVAPASYGAALHYFTGSKAHNIAVRRMAQERGLKLNEYGVFRGERRIAGATEPDVFRTVGLPWIPPELRENRGEIEAARADTLPRLVTLDSVRGDLQVHTTDSDGRDSLEAMAEAAEALGYEYIAITDHTPTVRVAGGLDREGFRAQMRRIDRLNAKLGQLTILKGAEVDIHADGSLDLDDATLAAFDIVLVSLHSKFDLSPDAQTKRVIAAIRHPSVDVFAHPTGRLIGTRRGARFDLDAVCAAAADRGVMLEVNAQPERLDLDDVGARAAVSRGATLAIGTDAHATAELRFMRWGVEQARRGWAEAKDVANTLPLAVLLGRLHQSRD